MFNKTYDQTSAECAALNSKLRGHQGGKLSNPINPMRMQVKSLPVKQSSLWDGMIICMGIAMFFFLIRALITR